MSFFEDVVMGGAKVADYANDILSLGTSRLTQPKQAQVVAAELFAASKEGRESDVWGKLKETRGPVSRAVAEALTLPRWLPWAAGGVALVVVLAVASPYVAPWIRRAAA